MNRLCKCLSVMRQYFCQVRVPEISIGETAKRETGVDFVLSPFVIVQQFLTASLKKKFYRKKELLFVAAHSYVKLNLLHVNGTPLISKFWLVTIDYCG